MTTKITDRDWELLSAFLDEELGARDKARLESRLQTSADMRAALEDLRRTRILLRSQPRLRAPRNFTLTAESAGIRAAPRPAPRLSPIFGMVSALASFLFVAVVLSELVVNGPIIPARQMTAAPSAFSDAQGVEAPAEEAAQTEAPLGLAIKSAPLAATPEAGSAYPNPAAEMLIQGSPAITETAMLSESEVTAATSIAAAPPVANDQTLSQTAAEPVSQPQPTFWNTWRLSELILIVLAIIAAMAAIRLRRTGN